MPLRYQVFVLLLIAVALAAPLIAPYDPLEAVMQNAYLPPSAEHLFGTDKLGRDNFSRILYGASYSLSSVLLLVTIILRLAQRLAYWQVITAARWISSLCAFPI